MDAKDNKGGEFSVSGVFLSVLTCVPSKVGFFTWEASWGKVLTLDQLKRRGWTLANRCFLCLVKEESIDHILIHCSKAKALWELIFALFGVS